MDIGSLTGRIELVDAASPVMAKVVANMEKVREGGRMMSAELAAMYRGGASSADTFSSSTVNAGKSVQKLSDEVAKLVNKFSGAELKGKVDDLSKALNVLHGSGQLTAKGIFDIGRAALELKAAGGALPPMLNEAATLTAKYGTAATQATGAITAMSVASVAAAIAFAAAVPAAILKTIKELYDLTKAAAETGDRIGDFSIRTGLAVERVAPLEFALKAAGSGLEKMENLLEKIQYEKAVDGSSRFSKALRDLNLDGDKFYRLPLDEKVTTLAERFRDLGPNVNKAQTAVALLGKQGEELLPVLDKLSPQLIELAKRNAAIWTKDLVEDAKAFNISLSVMEQTIAGVGLRIGMALLPPMAEFMENLAGSEKLIRSVTDISEVLVHVLGWLTTGFGLAMVAAHELNEGLRQIVETTYRTSDATLMLAEIMAKRVPKNPITDAVLEGLATARAALRTGMENFRQANDAIGTMTGELGQNFIYLGMSLSQVEMGGKGAADGLNGPGGAGPAARKFAEDVDKMVKSLLGIPTNLPETMAALSIAISKDLNVAQIKTVVDRLVAMRDIGAPLTKQMKEFLETWEEIGGSKGQAATKTLEGYAAAAQAAADNLNLVGLALKNAQLDQKQAQGTLAIERMDKDLSPEERLRAHADLEAAIRDERLKAQQDFDKAQLNQIYTYNAAALAAHNELNLRDLELTNAKLDADLAAAERGLRMQLAAGVISQETYEKNLMSVQVAYEDKRLKASTDYHSAVAAASTKNYAKLLESYQSYQEQAALIGLKGTDLALAQLKQEYDERIKALGKVTEQERGLWEKNKAAIEDWYKRQHELLEAARDDLAGFNQAMGGVLDVISKLATITAAGGEPGKFSKVLQGVGQIAGFSQLGAQSASHFRAANVMGVEAQQKYDVLQQGYFAGNVSVADYVKGGQSLKNAKIMSGVGKGMAVAEGAMNVWEATEGGGLKGIGGGAMAGMQAGAAFGPWGMAVGAAAGVLVGVAKSFSNNTKKAREEFAKSMGKDSLGGLYEDLQKLGKEGEKLADVGMHVIGKKDEAGNKKWMDDVKKFYEDIEKEVAGLSSATGLWSDQQSLVAKHLGETAEGQKQLKEIQKEQVARAGAGISQGLAVTDQAMTARDALRNESAMLHGKLTDKQAVDAARYADLQKKYRSADEVHKAGILGQMSLMQAAADDTFNHMLKVDEELEKQNKIIGVTQLHSEKAAKAVSSSLLGVVMSQIASGESFTDAIRGSGPAIEALGKQLEETGFEGGKAFDFLRESAAIVNDEIAGPALVAAEGYASAMGNLANAGLMDEETFQGLAEQITGTQQALEESGFSHGAVMAAMQGDLQKIWEMQDKYGYAVDDATQALIDEGVASGLVGEQAKSDNEKILDVLVAIGKALGADIPEGLEKMVKAGGGAAKQIEKDMSEASRKMAEDMERQALEAGRSLEGIADHAPGEIIIPVSVSTGDGGGDAQSHAGGGIVYAAGGARILPFRPRGTDTVPAMLTPGERVLTVDETRRYDAGGAGANLHITLMMPDGDVLLKQVVKSRKRLG